jgi:hypothetical protein
MNTTITKNIIATIAYYDVFDYPLTSFEIWKYFLTDTLESISYREVIEHIVKKRLRRGKLAIAKQKGVLRLVRWLRYIPFIRMIALTGSLAMKNSEASGDWDLLIVLRTGHIWTGRALCTALIHIFGRRRHSEDIADRACLNYWITSQSLEIGTKDLFSSNEYYFITPLFGFDEYQKFQRSNMWIRRFHPQFAELKTPHLFCIHDTAWIRFVRNIGEVLLSDVALESLMRRIQKKKILNNPLTDLQGSLIEATDRSLIFLPKPQGPSVYEKYKKNMSNLEALA